MRAVVSLAVALSALLIAPQAARPCGGGDDGGDDGGGDSGSSGGDGGGYGSPTTAEPACVEVSAVVGRSACSSFGEWDASRKPRLQVSVGTSVHAFPTAGLDFHGTAHHETLDVQYRIPGEELRGGSAGHGGTLDLRVVGSVGSRLYLGGEVNFGGAAIASGARMAGPEGTTLEPHGATYVGGGALAGIAVPLGRVMMRAEMLVGARAIGLSVTSYHPSCDGYEHAIWDGQLVMQPRARLEWWTSPWVTLGGYVGADALRDDDISAGVFLQGHLRAFDGTRAR